MLLDTTTPEEDNRWFKERLINEPDERLRFISRHIYLQDFELMKLDRDVTKARASADSLHIANITL